MRDYQAEYARRRGKALIEGRKPKPKKPVHNLDGEHPFGPPRNETMARRCERHGPWEKGATRCWKCKESEEAQTETNRIENLPCPQCGHQVKEHYSQSTFFFTMIGRPNVRCQAYVERRDSKGFVRLDDCPCDFTRAEAVRNAKDRELRPPIDADELLRLSH